jgi:hypothetical protein
MERLAGVRVAVTMLTSQLNIADVYAYWRAMHYGHARPSPNPFDDANTTAVVRFLRMRSHVAYEVYLRSNRWRQFRAAMLDLVDGTCERCGLREDESRLLVLDVHHQTYERLGCELPDDVLVLCRPCHDAMHP